MLPQNSIPLIILVFYFSLNIGYVQANPLALQSSLQTSSHTIAELGSLNTVEATNRFLREAERLQKRATSTYSAEKASFKISSQSEKKAFVALSQWTPLWRDIGTYYADFQPRSRAEAYGEFFAKLMAALSEATVSAEFIGYRAQSPDHLKVMVQLTQLKITLLKLSTKIQVSADNANNPRRLGPLQALTQTGNFKNIFDADREISGVVRQLRLLREQTKGKTPSAKTDQSFRMLMDKLVSARVRTGKLLDCHQYVQMSEFFRASINLTMIEGFTLYLMYKTNDAYMAVVGLQAAKINEAHLKANAALFEKMKSSARR